MSTDIDVLPETEAEAAARIAAQIEVDFPPEVARLIPEYLLTFLPEQGCSYANPENTAIAVMTVEQSYCCLSEEDTPIWWDWFWTKGIEPAPYSAPLPEIKNFQAHMQVAAQGLTEDFQRWLGRQPPVRNVEWDRRPTFSREGSIVVDGLLALNQSTSDIDNFFRAAAKL